MSTIFIDEAIDQLRESFRGDLIGRSSPKFELARHVRNGLIDRSPAVVARCTGTADVIAAVNFAREREMLVSVRGGSHNVAGVATNDDGIVIDLSAMRGVHVDPVARTASVMGGATWADVDRETQVFGMATPGGVISSTGVGGLSMLGGFGRLRRKFGYSLDNILAAEIVTADGKVRTASETENPDLYWGIRGAGPNFGVVTSLTFKLHEVGPTVFWAMVMYDLADAETILPAWRSFMDTAPDEVSSNALFWTFPESENFPEELHGRQFLCIEALHAGDPSEGEHLLAPLRNLATPLLDLSSALPYAVSQGMFDWLFPEGNRYYWKSTYLNDFNSAVEDRIIEIARDRPVPSTLIALWNLKGGAASRVPADATAFGDRASRPYLLSFDTMWTDHADDDRCIAWTREKWAEMKEHSPGGIYLNFAGFSEEKETLLRESYGANFDRLVDLKTKYDPSNLFRLNQNIRPRT